MYLDGNILLRSVLYSFKFISGSYSELSSCSSFSSQELSSDSDDSINFLDNTSLFLRARNFIWCFLAKLFSLILNYNMFFYLYSFFISILLKIETK